MDPIDIRIKELVDMGCRPDEVMADLQMSKTVIYRRAKANGIKWKYEKCKSLKKDRSDVRLYKAEGHTAKEVAERFGISCNYAKELTRGIAPQVNRGNQWQRMSRNEVDARASAIVAKKLHGFEYAGNYTGSDGTADIACKTCGTVKRLSWVAIRHGSARCEYCWMREVEKRKATAERNKQRRAEAKANKTIKRHDVNYWKKHKCKQLEFNICPVCGTIVCGKQYCSTKCRHKAENKRKDIARRTKVRKQIVDKDITLEKLYERDGGVCYLCGGVCDWNDKEERDETIVCGNLYPSIDHVVPLSAGGKHSWKNVRLAHRLCNSIKSDKLLA